MPPKRQRITGTDDEEDEVDLENGAEDGPDILLTSAEVRRLNKNIRKYRDEIIYQIGTERTERKDKLREALNGICDAYLTISSAYSFKLGVESVAEKCQSTIAQACERLEGTCAKLDQAESVDVAPAQHTYASIAYQRTTKSPMQSVALGRGKSFPLVSAERVIIGPREDNSEKFPNSKATKEALRACVNPKQLKLKVQNVRFGPGCSVMLEGDHLNIAALQKCESIAQAGLEIKPKSSWNPRVIIHDIPVYLERDDIVNCIIDQNLQEASVEDVQVKYLYPAANKKYRSCVVELLPEHRVKLLKNNRVNIKWMACRVDDHVSIRQCYNCMGFGHIAGACKNKACCAFCAEEHLSKDCKSRKKLKCVNCHMAKCANVAHSATDKGKCGLLRKKIEQKLPFVNYGH